MDFNELAKDGLKGIFVSGGGGSLSAAIGATAFKAYALPDCFTSPLNTGEPCSGGLQWQALGETFHSAAEAAAFFGKAIGAILVLIWIIKLIGEICESNPQR
jgi:hypothetical protein